MGEFCCGLNFRQQRPPRLRGAYSGNAASASPPFCLLLVIGVMRRLGGIAVLKWCLLSNPATLERHRVIELLHFVVVEYQELSDRQVRRKGTYTVQQTACGLQQLPTYLLEGCPTQRLFPVMACRYTLVGQGRTPDTAVSR
jgi:hypothetical protein